MKPRYDSVIYSLFPTSSHVKLEVRPIEKVTQNSIINSEGEEKFDVRELTCYVSIKQSIHQLIDKSFNQYIKLMLVI